MLISSFFLFQHKKVTICNFFGLNVTFDYKVAESLDLLPFYDKISL